ncbi:MAG: hypothetical protein FD149_918 [Rhodospirillaceae bacterium]|nr:MAG: hypothetical protein FD149_918 [Rhodospirillaceae bacterium]
MPRMARATTAGGPGAERPRLRADTLEALAAQSAETQRAAARGGVDVWI